jgi:hypothetical protein
MPRQWFDGQSLIDFLLARGYHACPDPPGPPIGAVTLSLDCDDDDAHSIYVHTTVELGAAFAEKNLTRAGIDPQDFWGYLDAHS